MIIHDGHVHTPWCPHGTMDSLAEYCEEAIKLGLKGITFAEHAPLPPSFTDPTPLKDSGMDPKHLESYIDHIQALKKEYKGKLDILLGLEVDYIEGFEHETTYFLNEVGSLLDDSILSVHFLKIDEDYFCIDYSPDTFAEAIQLLGSTENVYKRYFQTVLASIEANIGHFKPKRIGHITLVRKFHKRFPTDAIFNEETTQILSLIQKKGYELDYNGAGCIKPLCKEPYPYDHIIDQAIELNIPLVYGSDAHQVSALMSGHDQLVPNAPLTKPIR